MRKNDYTCHSNYLNVIVLIFLVAIFGCSSPKPEEYSSESINGFIVDEESDLPVDGAHIVAYWMLKVSTGGDGDIDDGLLNLVEVVTDDKGAFEIPAWGPKKIPKNSIGTLKSESPGIIVFKEGYHYRFLSNVSSYLEAAKDHQYSYASIARSDSDGSTINLRKFNPEKDKCWDSIRGLRRTLERIHNNGASEFGFELMWFETSLSKMICGDDNMGRSPNNVGNYHKSICSGSLCIEKN